MAATDSNVSPPATPDPDDAPLDCASCGPPIPARVLVLHRDLALVAVPLCGTTHVSGNIRVVTLDSTEGRKVMETYRIARSYVIPRELPRP